MRKSLLSGLVAVSMSLAGAGTALASDGAEAPKHSFRMFGKTYCMPGAPAHTACDVRLGSASSAQPAKDSRVLTLFGTRICIGDVGDATCDVRFPTREQTATASWGGR